MLFSIWGLPEKTVQTQKTTYTLWARANVTNEKEELEFLTLAKNIILNKKEYLIYICENSQEDGCTYDSIDSYPFLFFKKRYDIDVQNDKLLIIPSPDMTKDDIQALQSQISDRDDMIIKGSEDSLKNENEEQKSIKNGQTK